ncbi:mCG147320 [Mus musculus]|nr:mCG147320 [Mus musculus]
MRKWGTCQGRSKLPAAPWHGSPVWVASHFGMDLRRCVLKFLEKIRRIASKVG